jgi:hypothetical protein
MNKVDSRPAAYAPTLTREEVLRRAEALIPKLRERAETAEKLRRCPRLRRQRPVAHSPADPVRRP